jgi:hypothetical protein
MLLSGAVFTGPAAPFVAVAGAIAEFLGAMGVGSGCGQTCVLSSAYANKAEALLQQNINTYMSIPAPRAASAQAAALAMFDAIWNDLKTQCAAIGGGGGAGCISDRQAGACKWKQRADSVPAWGKPAVGECWNWFSGYRDPIAKDPNVVPDASLNSVSSAADSVSSAAGSALQSISGATGVSSTWLLAGAAVVVGLLVFKR